jgi:hypothetical protein
MLQRLWLSDFPSARGTDAKGKDAEGTGTAGPGEERQA